MLSQQEPKKVYDGVGVGVGAYAGVGAELVLVLVLVLVLTFTPRKAAPTLSPNSGN